MDTDAQRTDETEEIRLLREKVAELENRLREMSPGAARANAAERAAAGLFDESPFMLFIADLVEGRFLHFNDKVCEVLGFTRKEILESSFLDRVHPEDHAATMKEMEQLVAGEPTSFRNRHRGADGLYRTFDWMAIADSEGELCFAMAVVVSG